MFFINFGFRRRGQARTNSHLICFNYTTMPFLWLFLFPNVSLFEMSSTLFSSDQWLVQMTGSNKNLIIIIVRYDALDPK